VGGVIAPVLVFLLPAHDPRPGIKIRIRFNEIDFLGAILIIGAFISLVMAISFGGVVYAWNSGQTIGLFVCTGVLWILFSTQQILCIGTDRIRRLFPIELFKSYEMCILFALTAASITSCFVPIYFLPLYYQFALNNSALEAAVHLLPFVFVLVTAVILNGVLMGKFGYYMPWYLCGGVLVVIGSALMYTIDLDTSDSKIYGYSVLIALGTGFFSQASFPIAQAKVGPHQISAATGFIGSAQVGGMAIALSVSNAIFLNEATTKISAALPNAHPESVRAAVSGADGAFLQTLSGDDRNKVLNAIVDSIRNVFIMVIVAGVLTVCTSVFMKRDKLFIEPAATTEAETEKKADEEKVKETT